MAATRRRQRGRLLAGLLAGATALLVTSVAVAWSLWPSGPAGDAAGADGGPPSPELAGQQVVTSYLAGHERLVLDPSTGDYHPVEGSAVAVSPDLRTVAAHHAGGVLVAPTTGGPVRTIAVPIDITSAVDHPLVWSPDGTMLAVTSPYGNTAPEWPRHRAVAPVGSDAGDLSPFYRVVLVDVPAGTSRVINLGIPRWYHSYGTTRTGRIGAFGGVPSWIDDEHLAVPVTSLPPDPDDIVNGDTIGVFNLSGTLVREVSLPEEELAELRHLPPEYRLNLSGRTPDGVFLLLGPVSGHTIALRGLPDGAAGGDGFAWRFDLPRPPNDTMWTACVAGWTSGREVLIRATQVPLPGRDITTVAEEHEWRVIDVTTGEIRKPDDLIIPDTGARQVTVGAAEWLSAVAAERAFAP